MTEIKPKKGGNKISKTQKAGTSKKTLYEEENETPSRNASYTPVVGFFLLSLCILYIFFTSHLTIFFIIIGAREKRMMSFIPHYGA